MFTNSLMGLPSRKIVIMGELGKMVKVQKTFGIVGSAFPLTCGGEGCSIWSLKAVVESFYSLVPSDSPFDI